MGIRVRNRAVSRRGQSGVVLIAFAALLAIVSVGLVVDKLATRSEGNSARERTSNEALARAKADLIAWSVSHPTEPGRLPWPDRNGDGDYDGTSDCVTTGFSNTHLLGRFPYAGDTTPCDVATFSGYTVDGFREPLWYAVSRNLLWNRGQAATDPPLNPGLLDSATYPWLTVRDQNGNVLSNRVAAVLIAPGGVVGIQARSGAAPNPNQFLDNVTISATNYDNSDADLDFIIYPDSRKTSVDSDSFNDQLTYITIDELMRPVEKRVLGDAAVSLQAYRTARGRFPWLSPYRDPTLYTAGDTMTGRLEDVNGGGDRIIDDEANFPEDVLDDHVIINVTRRTVWEIQDQHDPDDLHIKGSPDFEPGDAYNIRPAYNGVWGQREGHIPYIDNSVNEQYAFVTGFTLSWINGSTTPPPDCNPTLPLGFTISVFGCSQLQNSYQSGTFTQPPPVVPATGGADGECIWRDDINRADCFCHTADCDQVTEVREPAYTIELCVISCGTTINLPVRRTLTYTFDFTGTGAITSVGNVKTRQVNSTSPEVINMTDDIQILGLYYTIWSGTVTVPSGDYAMDGIYYDIEDGNELPGYFFTNLWHHYIYARIGANHVAINTTTGNPSTDNCTPGTDCIELEIGGSTVRNDIQAVLVGAGGELAGQDRTDGEMSDYFEDENEDQGNDVAERKVAASDFNDQVRVIRPNPP